MLEQNLAARRTPAVVVLTGGIASGKSQVRKLFEARSIPCIDADVVAKTIQSDPAHPANRAISLEFPSAIVDGIISRSRLRELVSLDPDANNRLIALMTPHVMSHLIGWTRSQSSQFVIWESALVHEKIPGTDRTLVVDVEPDIQIARLRTRTPDWTSAQIDGFISQQTSRADRLKLGDDVINNNGDLDGLSDAVGVVFEQYSKYFKG